MNVQNSLATEIQSTQPPQLPSNTLNHSLTIKLGEHNYLLWKSQILTIIRTYDLEDHFKGITECPPKTLLNSNTINPLYLRWQKHDQTILNWIFLSLSEGIHAQIINSAASFAAWDNLEKLFTSQVRARIRQYRIQLQFTKKDTLSMTKYLVKKQGFVDKMAASSHLVPHEKQIEHILNGLSPEYESFVTSISTRPGGIGELDTEEFRSLLLIQENHLDITNGGQRNKHNNPSMNNDQRNNSGGKNSQHFQNKNLQNNNFSVRGRVYGQGKGLGNYQNKSKP